MTAECIAQASSFSRVIRPPRLAKFSLAQHEGAERRQALGMDRHPLGGPVTQARRARSLALASPRKPAHAVCASGGRSPLGAPPRRFFGPEPVSVKPLGVAVPAGLHVAHSRVPLVVAEGRCCRAPPGCCLRGNARDAGPALLDAVATSTLGGRDITTIGETKRVSNFWKGLCAALSIAAHAADAVYVVKL